MTASKHHAAPKSDWGRPLLRVRMIHDESAVLCRTPCGYLDTPFRSVLRPAPFELHSQVPHHVLDFVHVAVRDAWALSVANTTDNAVCGEETYIDSTTAAARLTDFVYYAHLCALRYRWHNNNIHAWKRHVSCRCKRTLTCPTTAVPLPCVLPRVSCSTPIRALGTLPRPADSDIYKHNISVDRSVLGIGCGEVSAGG